MWPNRGGTTPKGCRSRGHAPKPGPVMDGNWTLGRRAALRTLALAVALALPASVSAPVQADDSSDAFAASFSSLAAPAVGLTTAANAVDLTSFTPPIEQQADSDDAAPGQALGSGVASFYGRQFNGRPTASGERFDMNALTAAHRSLPFGSRVRVTNPRNGKSVVVRINDRGPYAHSRVIDLSRAAASEIGIVGPGSGTVELALLGE